jgi:hypothetical protein
MNQIVQHQNFILVASRGETLEGKPIPAEKMAGRRLNAKRWGLYANTPHRAVIKKGDNLLIYVAGSGAMRFVARASVAGVDHKVKSYEADGDALTAPPVAVLMLDTVQWFEDPVQISAIKDLLSFVPKDTPKWGCVLQRGLKLISDADAATVLAAATFRPN